MIIGCAACRAARAAPLSPEAIASSTLRTKLRMRVRGTMLTAVRWVILRAAFLAEGVFAIVSFLSLGVAADAWSGETGEVRRQTTKRGRRAARIGAHIGRRPGLRQGKAPGTRLSS